MAPKDDSASLSDSFPADVPSTSKRRKLNDAPSRVTKVKSKETLENRTAEAMTRPIKNSFEALGVAPWIISSLSALQITNPTPIQEETIPAILKGSDCVGVSNTGSGKTVAFSVPILQKWGEDGFGIYALILTPTRYFSFRSDRTGI
jgi:ATP-dependent RNA helicase DDX49/DBP8